MSLQLPDAGLVRRVADQAQNCQRTAWFYGDSIGFEGLEAASRMLGDNLYEGFAWGYGRGARARDPKQREMDNTVPGRALVGMAARRGDTKLITELAELCHVLGQRRRIAGLPVSFERADLVPPHGGERLTREDAALLADPGSAVYVDCLHFDPPFLTALGAATGDDVLTEAGIQQAEDYISLLQDTSSGLFYHFYLASTGTRYIRGWSRGQGWALLGLLDCLESCGISARTARLVTAVESVVTAVLQHQRANGHWGSLVDDQDSSDESSAAAFFVAGFLRGRRLGVLDDSVLPGAELAWAATLASTSADGTFGGVSAAVRSSTVVSHYRHVPLNQLVPWGQGPWLLAAEEVARFVSGDGPAQVTLATGREERMP